MRDFAKYLAGAVLAGVLLWWVLRGTDLSALGHRMLRASPWAMLLAMTLNLGHNVFRVWRWKALLAPVRRSVRFRSMFAAVIIGYMTTWVVPGRLGELVRPLLLSAKDNVPLGPCIGSVVADRLLDAATVVGLFVVGCWITPLQGRAAEYASLIRSISILLALGVAAAIALMSAVSLSRKRLQAWLEKRSGLLRWIGGAALSLSTGVDALRSPRLVAMLVVQSLLAWIAIASGTWFGVRSVGADVSFGTVLVIMPMLALGVAVPTPGGAGSYHGAMKLGLMLFGVSQVVAVSAGFVMHVLITVPVILLGTVLLWTEGISWRELVASAAEIRKLGTPADPPPLGEAVEKTS